MIIKNKANGKVLASNVILCESFIDRCRGLMFRKISESDSCILINSNESVFESSIHMMFVPQDLEVVWADEDLRVVDVKKCKKGSLNPLTWRTYKPRKAAKYVIELLNAKGTLKGDRLQFIKQR